MLDLLRNQVLDNWCLQTDGFTNNRHRKVERLIAAGPIESLNIGCGGGIETLKLLRKGNHVTLAEIDAATAERARERVERNGFSDRFEYHVGHVLELDLGERQFDQIMMCEVLEHIINDFAVLEKLARWLKPGGRLILTTPTCSYGQLGKDQLSIKEDGGHVRVGYDGPELDRMLEKVGMMTVLRVFNGYIITQRFHELERLLRQPKLLGGVFGFTLSIVCRPLVPIMDLVAFQPNDQITLAVKVD